MIFFSVRRLRRLLLVAASLAAATAPAAAVDEQIGKPEAVQSNRVPVGETEVTIEKFAFTPAEVTVKAGSTVTWVNRDELPHSVAGDGFSSDMLDKDMQFSHTYTEPGSYDYICPLHPAHMKGRVIVTP